MRRNPNLVLSVIAAAYGLSSMGDQMAMVALTLRLHDQGRSGAVISALVIGSVLPIVVVGPLAGPLLDRVESGRLVVAVTALQAVVALGLALTRDVVATIALLALLGAGLAVVSPTLQLLVPEIVGDADTTRGFARLETFRSVGNVAGPALAGVLVAGVGDRAVLLGNAGSFAVVAGVFLVLRIRREPAAAGDARLGWLGQVRQGVDVLGGDRLLRVAIPALATAIVFTAMMNVARVFFIRDDLGASDAGYGWLVTGHTVGMLLAAAFLAARIPLAWQPRVLAGAGVMMGGALFGSATVPVFAFAFAAFVLTGVANALQNLAIRNLIHARVPRESRGRAFASSSAALNGANLTGTALAGPAATSLGGAGALQLAGVGTLLVSLAAAPILLRQQPVEPTTHPAPPVSQPTEPTGE
ncbi:MFS transporter [Embleya sp. NPDC005575]|uniref:MFS transporter n=1 Tax=Embleya sp. NPDC005575 TaxID=3156892 RepID=UPI0033B0D336